jgi:hypothetical protein
LPAVFESPGIQPSTDDNHSPDDHTTLPSPETLEEIEEYTHLYGDQNDWTELPTNEKQRGGDGEEARKSLR